MRPKNAIGKTLFLQLLASSFFLREDQWCKNRVYDASSSVAPKGC